MGLRENHVISKVTVFQENRVLFQGRFLRVNDVDKSLLLMLQDLLSTSETSESIAGRLYSVFTAASAEGFCLDVAPDDNVSLHVQFGRNHVFFSLRSPSHSKDADHTASSSRLACTISDVLLEAVSKTRLPSCQNLVRKCHATDGTPRPCTAATDGPP